MDKRIVSEHYPFIAFNLDVHGTSSGQTNIEALLDSGFTGDVALPDRYFTKSRRTPDAFAQFRLADGSATMAPVFQGVATFPELSPAVGPLYVTVISIGDEPLIGRGLADRFLITLDHGRRLILEP